MIKLAKIIMGLVAFGNVVAGYSQTVSSGPPEPPLGKRWVVNPDFSDEFNGTQLDTTKWYDHHPTWKGREPGIFLSSQVSVKDGFLQIKGEKLKKDTIVKAYGKESIYNIAGGAVVSKKSVLFGYYETKVKAAATSMSTTFWFSTNGTKKGAKDCDNYGLEWDIHESIGRDGNFSGSYFAHGMHSNSHYWYTDCNKEKHDYRAAAVNFNNPEVSSARFHVYGGWWRDEQNASYYYNNSEPKHQKFYDKISDKPFDRPMHMRLVSETYPFPWIELPTDEELADPTKNVVYYDWVRGYKLVDVTDANKDAIHDPSVKLFDETILFHSATIDLPASNVLKIPLAYKALEDREIFLKLSDADGKKITETKWVAYAGYAHLEYELKLDKPIEVNKGYSLMAKIRPLNVAKPKDIDMSTLIINVTENKTTKNKKK
ncbi:beta-porphyranase D [Flavobacterium sp. NG2]|uniref:beta-porphyranase D n=1 Tax=Flavobacterium sp. NG2 TaxID=3097547 RepID=UPI002A812831|nr:beta-porphyranase D [Flavobacterium sp. NG2]WPR71103.1 beta-porphyranase D [Flavobacterium sp. NG2]